MAEVQFQIISDLHLESPAAYGILHVDSQASYLAVIGDIGYVKDDGFFRFLRNHLKSSASYSSFWEITNQITNHISSWALEQSHV